LEKELISWVDDKMMKLVERGNMEELDKEMLK
jgi:hypothetical protein